jgi:hypothetical protein
MACEMMVHRDRDWSNGSMQYWVLCLQGFSQKDSYAPAEGLSLCLGSKLSSLFVFLVVSVLGAILLITSSAIQYRNRLFKDPCVRLACTK